MTRDITYISTTTPNGNSLGIERTLIFKEDVDRLNPITIPWIPNNSVVHFHKSMTYSRFKFRQWGKDKNITITRNHKKADIILFDKTQLKSHYNAYRIEILYRLDQEIKGTYYICNTAYDNYIHKDDYKITGKAFTYILYSKKAREELDTFLNILENNTSSKYMDYDDFITQVTKDNMVLDHRSYTQCLNMINAKDKSIAKTGQEILSNVNIENSRFYIDTIYKISKLASLTRRTSLIPLYKHRNSGNFYTKSYRNRKYHKTGLEEKSLTDMYYGYRKTNNLLDIPLQCLDIHTKDVSWNGARDDLRNLLELKKTIHLKLESYT